jgi:hypothetical protein
MNGGPKGGHDDWVALVVGCGLRMNGRFAPQPDAPQMWLLAQNGSTEVAPMRFYDWSSVRSADAVKKSAVAKPSVN